MEKRAVKFNLGDLENRGGGGEEGDEVEVSKMKKGDDKKGGLRGRGGNHFLLLLHSNHAFHSIFPLLVFFSIGREIYYGDYKNLAFRCFMFIHFEIFIIKKCESRAGW